MLRYDFMQYAFVAAIFIAIIIPLMGTVIVLRRLSTIGEALSHTSLAGVAVGLVFGFNPTLTAAVLSILASLAINVVRRYYPKYAEISVNIVLSAGIGLAAILSGFAGNSANFNSYLFGSILVLSKEDLLIVAVFSVLVIGASILLYRPLFSITFYEENARLSGLSVNAINTVFSILTAVTVSVAAGTVGALIVSSFIVLPVACSLLVAKSYKSCILYSMAFGGIFSLGGLIASFYLDLKPGGTMTLTGVAVLLIMLLTVGKKNR